VQPDLALVKHRMKERRKTMSSTSIKDLTCEEADDRLAWLEQAAGRALVVNRGHADALVDELELMSRASRQVAKHFRTEHDHRGEDTE
jgi:hypothetical protein